MLDADSCYRAMLARDSRFDGLFFVAVSTTGVYCRPICPARTPGRSRCSFFRLAAEAERAGYRACFRCRPELAPGNARVDARSTLVHAALLRIEEGFLDEHSVDALAEELSVTSRHLRRAMSAELGLSPVELAQSRRLAAAKRLLQDSSLALAEVAFAAGFTSLRRFHALFRSRFGRSPSALRRREPRPLDRDSIPLRLDYRPPLDWTALLQFLGERAIEGVEMVEGERYRRVVTLPGRREITGWIEVRPDATRPALQARLSLSLAPGLAAVVARLRALFDLDAQPAVVAAHLERDALLRPLVRRRPGLRVVGAFDGFEVGVRAIVGQRVSVRAATTVLGRLVAAHGPACSEVYGGLSRAFPAAATLAAARPESLAALGLPRARAGAIVELARAVVDGRVDLSGGAAPDDVVASLQTIAGVGPWTAAYVAMRALRSPNAFVAGDLVVRRALDAPDARAAERRASAWQPWRSYAVMHLWNAQTKGSRHADRESHPLPHRLAQAARR
jgi:AraC family transcriptional regulator of adaptative response / DNA-3-methyladenine glycosylase II